MKILNKLKLLLALLFLPLALITNANAFPDKGVTLIVAYGAGGGTDRTARLLAKDLETTIGQPVTVKNVTGGGGWNGWELLHHLIQMVIRLVISMCQICTKVI